MPLITAGAVVAGLAGGMAVIRRRNNPRHNGALDLDKLISAAKRLGSLGEALGQVASVVERATEESNASS